MLGKEHESDDEGTPAGKEHVVIPHGTRLRNSELMIDIHNGGKNPTP